MTQEEAKARSQQLSDAREEEAKTRSQQMSGARDMFALASDDGQRINSSDSNTIVVILTSGQKAQLLDLLEARFEGKEKNLDKCVEKCFVDGMIAQLRSVAHSKQTRLNAEIAELCRNHKGTPEELLATIKKVQDRK